MPGYSSNPLWKKLGYKPDFRVKTRNAPDEYRQWLGTIPFRAEISSRLRSAVDLWHLFTTSRRELESCLTRAMGEITIDGMIWVSWPKKSSKIPSEITEDTIREVALPMGLVDVKVCAVSEIWSGLKLVIRKELRSNAN